MIFFLSEFVFFFNFRCPLSDCWKMVEKRRNEDCQFCVMCLLSLFDNDKLESTETNSSGGFSAVCDLNF